MTRCVRLALLVLLLGAGCGSSGGTVTTADSPSPSSEATTSAPSVTPSPGAKAQLVLEPDGLGYLVGEASVRHLTFAATSAAQIQAALDNLLGKGKREASPECGQGARQSWSYQGFSLLLDGTKFVGWLDQGAGGRTLTSLDGVGVGISLAQLRTIHPGVTITQDTLGPEFRAGSHALSGFLNGRSDSSKVTSVYAGETCVFR